MAVVSFAVGLVIATLAIHFTVARMEDKRVAWGSAFIAAFVGMAASLAAITWALVTPAALPLFAVSDVALFSAISAVAYFLAVHTLIRLKDIAGRPALGTSLLASGAATAATVTLPQAIQYVLREVV